MNNILLTFGPNDKGRDFVIGDLHGALSCFENLLKNLNFDKATDRMFSVGDLVDRGPNSLGTLRLLREPWFHCTLSNHEQMMLEAFNGGYMGAFWEQNGGTWGSEALNVKRALERRKHGDYERSLVISDEDMEVIDLLELVEQLPFLITIEHKSGKKYHIIHAELPPGELGLTDSDLSSPGRVHALATKFSGDGDAFLWGRNQFMPFYRKDVANMTKLVRTAWYHDAGALYSDALSHIISGHTIIQHPITLVGQTNIDTCAYGSYPNRNDDRVPNWCALTCICLDDWNFCQATETEFRFVEPLVITRADLT